MNVFEALRGNPALDRTISLGKSVIYHSAIGNKQLQSARMAQG